MGYSTTIGLCDITEYILFKQNRDRYKIDILKLMKLLYYCQGYSLVLRDKPLFGEHIQAWDKGPVIPSVWNKYHTNGKELHCKRTDISFLFNARPDIKSIIDKVHRDVGHLSAKKLSNRTHEEEPWKNTYNRGQRRVITTKLIGDYFRGTYSATLDTNEYAEYVLQSSGIEIMYIDQLVNKFSNNAFNNNTKLL